MNEQTSDEKKKRVKRSWSLAAKLAIVEEISAPGAGVSETARQHDISPALLFHWRRLARERKLAASEHADAGGFAVAQIVLPGGAEEVAGADSAQTLHPRAPGAMEISVSGAHNFDANVDADALVRVLSALRRSARPSDAGPSGSAR